MARRSGVLGGTSTRYFDGFDVEFQLGQYHHVQTIQGRMATGTLINRNHFAGLLNMAIPLAIHRRGSLPTMKSLDLMTICGHDKTMKRAMISELKARLSSYLAAVRKGETVIVCDRQTPIARLIPYGREEDSLQIREPSRRAGELKMRRGVRLQKRVDVVKLLREDRNQR
ncbi:type II toxin-antitoxin system prevent-host-death family antitoxin [Acidobacteria bacterium AH-259-L09]|nr:type II toxin-antitoxin system prevent-host-death family antitoxin [Acidobacteria bacterium AH-259-L09]